MSKFTIGQAVRWTSSNLAKTGIVVGIIPVKVRPDTLGFNFDGAGGSRYDAESYVVKGRAEGKTRDKMYWPVASVLSPASELTPAELEWCNANVEAVRGLISSCNNRVKD